MPHLAVSRGTGAARPWLMAIGHGLDAMTFTPTGGTTTITWNETFDANHTDGIMVLHHGKVVYGRCAG